MVKLHEILKEKGVEIRYKTPGVKLIRPNNNGRVTGVIGKKEDGTYVQINAKKGVILSCGGYDNNPDLMKKWLRPSDLRIERFNSANKICTGDAHYMGLEIGADIDEPPHCLIVGYGSVSKEEFYLVMFTPWLRVDKNGRRFVNEDSDYCRSANANAIQPGHFNWCIIDGPTIENASKGGWYKAQYETLLKVNAVVTAPTIEELAAKMKADPETFKATVARYNELAGKKKDDDFCVEGAKMKPLLQGPFYAFAVRNFALVTVSGLKINEHTQVLDKDGKVIPGLYASGNTSGSFFSDTYQRNVHGVSHGRAITFGRMAGKHAAAQKDMA
jgi:fumarate reductase flavoprotein subunit